MLVSDFIADKSLGATLGGTVYVYASGFVAPGKVQASLVGVGAGWFILSVGSFSSFTGMVGYNWRAVITVNPKATAVYNPWPDGAVMNLVVATAGGIQVGVVDISFAVLPMFHFDPSNSFPLSSESPVGSFYLECRNEMVDGWVDNDWPTSIEYSVYSFADTSTPWGYCSYCIVEGSLLPDHRVNFRASPVLYVRYSGSSTDVRVGSFYVYVAY
jgi:hypothetical protein